MKRRYSYDRYRAATNIKLTFNNFITLRHIISLAMRKVQNLQGRTINDIDGEVFTRIQQEMKELSEDKESDGLKKLFAGNLKDFKCRFRYLNNQYQDRMRYMFQEIRKKELENREPDRLQSLQEILDEMNANVQEIQALTTKSTSILREMEEVEEIIQGNQ